MNKSKVRREKKGGNKRMEGWKRKEGEERACQREKGRVRAAHVSETHSRYTEF
jgi:hypothetical protein